MPISFSSTFSLNRRPNAWATNSIYSAFSHPLRRSESLSHSNLPRATGTRHQRLTTRSKTWCFVLNSTSGPSLSSDYATILFCLTSLVPSVDPALSVLPKAQRTMGRYPVQFPAPALRFQELVLCVTSSQLPLELGTGASSFWARGDLSSPFSA